MYKYCNGEVYQEYFLEYYVRYAQKK